MQFYNSILLWTSVAALIPILIHLLNREKPQVVNIPTVKFIIKAVEKSSASRKLNNMTLLLIRMALLLALTFFVVKPYFEKPESISSTITHSIIILDNSIYTSHKTTNGTQLQAMKEQAMQIVKNIPEGSDISIFTINESSPFTKIKDYALDKINSIATSNEFIDIHAKIDDAYSLLNSLNTKGKIFVLSDMNKGAWNGKYKIQENHKHVLSLIDLPARKGNIFIESVAIKNSQNKVLVSRPLSFLVNLVGDRNLNSMTVSLFVEDTKIETKTVFEDLNEFTLEFEHIFTKAGTYQCEIKINTQDAINTDNIYYLTVKVDSPKTITVLHSGSQTPLYLKAALEPRGWHGKQKYSLEMITYKEFQRSGLNEKPEFVILTGKMDIKGNQLEWLKEYSESGGGLIFYPDELTEVDKLNPELFPFLQAEIVHSKGSSSIHPQSGYFSEVFEEKIKTVSSYQQFYLSNTSDVFHEVIITYDNTLSCLVKTKNSNTYFLGLPSSPELSNFLNSNTFPVLWHTLINSLNSNENGPLNFLCNENIPIIKSAENQNSIKVITPSGAIDTISKEDFEKDSQILKAEYISTDIPGHYQTDSSLMSNFSCNLPRKSEYYLFPDKSEYAEILKLSEPENVLEQSNLPSGKQLLQTLFILLFLLLALDTYMANGGKKC